MHYFCSKSPKSDHFGDYTKPWDLNSFFGRNISSCFAVTSITCHQQCMWRGVWNIVIRIMKVNMIIQIIYRTHTHAEMSLEEKLQVFKISACYMRDSIEVLFNILCITWPDDMWRLQDMANAECRLRSHHSTHTSLTWEQNLQYIVLRIRMYLIRTAHDKSDPQEDVLQLMSNMMKRHLGAKVAIKGASLFLLWILGKCWNASG